MVSSEFLITAKNCVLPAALILATTGLIFLPFKRLKKFAGLFIILFVVLEYAYFFNKYQPFAPAKFVFPNHPVFQFLQTTGFDRYFGYDRAYVDSNFATYYRVFSPEGYDPLYIRRYGEFLASSENKELSGVLSRSDAYVGKTDNANRQRVFDLLGIRTAIDKTDDPANDWGPDTEKFPDSQYQFIKQYSKWKFYERQTALPRAFLAGNYEIISSDDRIINRFADPDFKPGETIILETEPKIKPAPGGTHNVVIESYKPNKVIINTASDQPKLLFLSDNYYPGWKALVDGRQTEILRADYTFRAVSVPSGQHNVVFVYDSVSFKAGLLISLGTMGLLATILLWTGRGNNAKAVRPKK